MEDQAFVEQAVKHNDTWLPWLTSELMALGIGVTPSAGNFLLLNFPGEAGRDSVAADSYLTSQGIVLRRMEAYGLPAALRLTVGSEEANQAVVRALRDYLK